MTENWHIGQNLQGLLSEKFKDKGPPGLGTDFFPSILWSLGGELNPGPGVSKPVPPRYSLGWIKKIDLERFIAIEDAQFGYVAFSPSDDDANSPSKTVDYVDGIIEVR